METPQLPEEPKMPKLNQAYSLKLMDAVQCPCPNKAAGCSNNNGEVGEA